MLDLWEAKQAHQYIDKLVTLIEAEKTKAEAATFNFAGAKVMQLEPLKMPSWSFNAEHPNAQKIADEMYAQDKEISKRNQEIIANNRKVYDALVALMKNLGFSTVKRGKLVRGKRIGETSDWAQHLYMIPTHEITNIDSLYEQWCKQISDLAKKRKEMEDKKEKEREAEDKKRAELRLVVGLGIKYGQEFSSIGNAIHYLLSRDKYLRLAYYLSKNRGDWSDGPSYAEMGIENFNIETADDVKIYKEISGLISDWDGDGRCFRDCEWNYGELYGMANKDLKNDLFAAMEFESL